MTVVKARLESGLFAYGGLASGLRTISQREGARGLFSGISVTLLRDAPFSGLFVVVYRRVQALLGAESSRPSLPVNAAAGVVAGATSSLLTQPLDVVKTHLQTSDRPATLRAMRTLLRERGLGSLMTGIVPRSTRRTLVAAVSWAVYEHLGPVYEQMVGSGSVT